MEYFFQSLQTNTWGHVIDCSIVWVSISTRCSSHPTGPVWSVCGKSWTCYHCRLPNIGQTCYMNSSLQSLLVLTDFMNDLSSLEKDWTHVSGAKMLKELLKLRKSHTSTDQKAKVKLLLSFKLLVSMNAPVFMGNLQHVSWLISLSSWSLVIPAGSQTPWSCVCRTLMSSWPRSWIRLAW